MTTVLVVDDEPAVAASLSRLLRRRGFTVAVASDGHAALRMLAEIAADVVVSDFKMPGMTGAQLLRRFGRSDR